MTRKAAAFFLLAFSVSAYAAEKTVAIESAQTSEYVKTGDEGEIIRFSGNVVIIVTENESVSRIAADEIVYDKIRDMLEARGSVRYEHTSGKSGSEKFTGELFLFDLKKQEGVFLGGTVEQDSGKKDSDPYMIRAEVTGKDSSSTMAFKNGVLTTCDAEDPHWSINASRIWLLPGNEIAILNGIFFIGPLPLMYIPFFYYPSDEMIFHPVFGFRNREGYFVQTTSYVYGRKPLPAKKGTDPGNSFADFLQGDTLKEQKRQGFFLQNLKEEDKSTDPDYFKIIADSYSSLGTMVGFDGSFTTETILKSVSFNLYAGFSRTLFPPEAGIYYSTYNDSGEEDSNSGFFMGTELPFRYRANVSVQIDKKPFRLSVSMPFISDPFFKPDFLDRSEDLNWFTLLKDMDELAKGNDLSTETSFSWNVSGSLTPEMTLTGPYLNTASITSMSGVMTFNSKENKVFTADAKEILYSPERKFFYPEIIKPELSLSFGGTLLSSETVSKKKDSKESKADLSGVSNPFEPEKNEGGSSESTEDSARFVPSAGIALPPQPAVPVTTWSVIWTLQPSIVEEMRYDATEWDSPEDIDWNNYSSLYYQLKTGAKIGGSWAYDQDRFSVTSSLDFSGTKQDHPWLSPTIYDTDSEIDTVSLSDYKANVYSISTTEAAKYVPFNRNEMLKPMSVAWNFTGILYETEFDGTADEPSWDGKEFEWEKEFVTTHATTAVAGVAVSGHEQKLTVTSNLPPLLEAYTGTANFGWSFVSSTLTAKVYEKEDEYKKWFWDPFKATLSWTLPYGIKLGQEYAYDIEEEESARLNFTAGKGFLSAYYTINSAVPYRLDKTSGWMLDGSEKSFLPSAAGMVFNNASKPLQLYEWKNRIYLQAKLSSNLKFDLMKPTASSFDFAPSITLKIHEFLDLSFSSNSSNAVIARYYQNLLDLPVELPGETDALKDLANSFSFGDEAKRRASGFKLKSLSMEMTHYLHDWTANLKTTINPKLKTDGGYRYELEPVITFTVQWKPISDIKTTVKSKEGVFSLNTTGNDEETDD